jgi:hypothetical protein
MRNWVLTKNQLSHLLPQRVDLVGDFKKLCGPTEPKDINNPDAGLLYATVPPPVVLVAH